MFEMGISIFILIVGLVCLLVYIYRKGSGDGLMVMSIILVTLALVWVFDFGNGLYSRIVYSKETRAAWATESQRQKRLDSKTHTYRVYCPETDFTTWTETDKAEWKSYWGKEKSLRMLPGSESCYIHRS